MDHRLVQYMSVSGKSGSIWMLECESKIGTTTVKTNDPLKNKKSNF